MTPRLIKTLEFAAIAALLLISSTDSTLAQGGRRGGGSGQFGGPPGFGGGFPGFGGVTGEIRREDVRTELGLSDEQIEQVEALLNAPANAGAGGDFFQRIREAESDEERVALQEEFQANLARQTAEQEAGLQGILTPEQYSRLRQISWHRTGSAALARDDVAAELGLSSDQQAELKDLQAEQEMARREMGFRVSSEDREAFRAQWDTRMLSVLDETQKAKWEELRGPAPVATVADEQPEGRLGRVDEGAASENTGSTPAPAVVQSPVVSRAADLPAPAGAEVISSFGASSEAAARRGEEAREFSFNFTYAPWTDVLKLFAAQAGLTLDLEVAPVGTFNYYDDGKYTVTETLDILNGYLLPKGYVLVRRDRFLVCVAIDAGKPIQPNIVPYVTVAELANRGRNEMLTVIFPLEGANIDAAAAEVTNLIGPQGKVVGLKTTNSLVVTDIGDNLRRIHDLLQKISAGPQDSVFRSYTLVHVAVDEAETMVRALLGLQAGARNVSAAATGEDRRGGGGGGGFDPRMFERMREEAERRASGTPAAPEPQITSNLRTNSLLVSATPAQQKIVEEALAVIDVEDDGSGAFARSRKPYLQVYQVKDSDPQEVVKTLSVLIPGVVVNEDGRNDKIHILATEEQHREVAALIRQLDGMGSGEQVMVIPLLKMDPVTAAATLTSMFIKDGDAAPTIEPDLYGRQVMIRGTSAQITQAQQILTQLGEDGTGQRRPGEGGLIRTFPLTGRDPEEILPLLQRAFESSAPNPVRIVRPADRGPIRDIRTPGASSETPATLPDGDVLDQSEPSASLPDRRDAGGSRVPVRFAAQTESGSLPPPEPSRSAPARPAANPSPNFPSDLTQDQLEAILQALGNEQGTGATPDGAAAAGGTAPVTITLLGDDVLFSSSDPEALDRMEDLMNSVMQAIPPRTSWTIYPLENSDVITTAAMLQQIFPESDVVSSDSLSGGSSSMFGSLTSGFSSMTSSLSSMTGLSGSSAGRLQMIPYPVDNALFVSGPSHKVAEVEQMLQILDSGELSASLRNRVPRSIPVLYADVQEVLKVVQDVYKDSLESEQDRGARNAANMFAQMMGGGGGRGGGREQQSQPVASLSLGVDLQTSQLIVSANDQLFREIKTLVESIDNSARLAKRTVKVITLQHTSPSQITSTLTSLMPRVKVSATGSSGSSSSGSSSGGGGGGGSGNGGGGGDAEQFRRMFEERARAAQQGGGGGQTGQGGGGRGGFGGGGRGGFGGGGFGGGGFGGGGFGGGGRGGFGGGGR